jgi:hypothetical protein
VTTDKLFGKWSGGGGRGVDEEECPGNDEQHSSFRLQPRPVLRANVREDGCEEVVCARSRMVARKTGP